MVTIPREVRDSETGIAMEFERLGIELPLWGTSRTRSGDIEFHYCVMSKVGEVVRRRLRTRYTITLPDDVSPTRLARQIAKRLVS